MQTLNLPEESELINHSLDGDTQAYGQLVDRYKNAVFTIVLQLYAMKMPPKI